MEYTPIAEVTAVPSPAGDRAAAYGLPKIVIDGNDADVVYRTMLDAFALARAGNGPSLIECLTYRYSGHSRADPAKYRPEGELDRWKQRDPLKIYRKRLREVGIERARVDAIDREVADIVDGATEACRAAPTTSVDVLFTDVYADGGCAWRN
jgi:pyruvate dehydrogenase E1 component alpha subunit